MTWELGILGGVLAILAVMIWRRVSEKNARKTSQFGTPLSDEPTLADRRIAKSDQAKQDAMGTPPRVRADAALMFANLTGQDQQRIDDLLADGTLIHAVKLMRELSGSGLKEAKEAVEARKADLN